MNKPWYQKFITYSPWIITGFLFLGSLLSTIISSIDLITPLITYVGTVITLVITASIVFYLKRKPLRWITKDGREIHLKSFNLRPILAVIGILLGLWIPRTGIKKISLQEPLNPTQATEHEQRTRETEHPQKMPDLQSFNFDIIIVDAKGNVTRRRKEQAQYFIEDLGGGVTLDMVEIPAGNFLMGSSNSDAQRAFEDAKRYEPNIGVDSFNNETPQHKVIVPTFFMSKFEVTQAQWRTVANMSEVNQIIKPNPSHFKDDDRLPVEQVTWEDTMEFCARLSKKTGRLYRLPTEAEWEYACRAGTTTPFAFGETITPDWVNYEGGNPFGEGPKGVYREATIPVGSSGVANWFGLYDMHGNVMELCLDVWHDDYDGAPADGGAWLSGDSRYRVLRGGGWLNDAFVCRSAFRNKVRADKNQINVGFRIVMITQP